MVKTVLYTLAALGVVVLLLAVHGRAADSMSTPKTPKASSGGSAHGLWSIYEQLLKNAKYIDLTHTLTPSIPVWKGFDPSTFGPALNPENGTPYRYAK
ncbi:MAG TPA: hypothetical protein VNI35_04710, partial [Nitrospira sp.]|nr:hypothetical protein [Nitrospira sp.]